MKKLILSLIFAFAILSAANAYVNVEQPQEIDLINGAQTLKITVTTDEPVLDFSVIVPNTMNVQEVTLSGAENYENETNPIEYLGKESTAYLWSFKELTANTFDIEMTISSETNEKVYSVWIYPPSNFESKTITVSMGEYAEETSEFGTYVIMLIVLVVAAFLVYYLIIAYKQHHHKTTQKIEETHINPISKKLGKKHKR